jgi:hypothetical protein
MLMPRRSSKRSAGAKFPAKTAKAPRVSPGKGGHNLGTPRHCPATRAHRNVRTSY